MADSGVVSGAACSVCWLSYKTEGDKDLTPVAIPCGHSFCRSCLREIRQANSICPKCRLSFIGDVDGMRPNYALMELIEEVAVAKAQPVQSGSSTAAQLADMSSMMSAMQLSMNIREAASRREAAELQKQAGTMQEELMRMTLSLTLAQQQPNRRPQTISDPRSIPFPDIFSSNTSGSSNSNSGSGSSGGGGTSSSSNNRSAQPIPTASTPSQTILNLKSDDLDELLRLASGARGPTVINLCGRNVKYSGQGCATIIGDNLTLRNGTIHLSDGPNPDGSSLCIQGTGFEMHKIVVCGGYIGVCVNPGSEVTLRDCEVQGAYIGLWVGVSSNSASNDPTQKLAKLTALRLKVWGTGAGSGVGVGVKGSATLDQCEISGGDGHGILVSGDTPSSLTATNSTCCGNEAIGVVVHQGAHVTMTHCTMNDNKDGSVVVRHQGSRAKLVSCAMDQRAVAHEGGILDV